MPLYSLKCNSCKLEFERFLTIREVDEARCIRCAGKTRILITQSTYHAFPAGFWEHIGPKPIHISSRQQLKEECKKYDCYSVYLDPPVTFKNPNY